MMRPFRAGHATSCASPRYIARHGSPRSAADLTMHDCIIGWRRIPRPVWLLNDDAGKTFAQPIRVRHELSDGEALLASTMLGAGLCQLPTWLIGEHLKRGELVSVLDSLAGAEMPIHAVWPRSPHVQPKVRVVIDALSQVSRARGSGFRP